MVRYSILVYAFVANGLVTAFSSGLQPCQDRIEDDEVKVYTVPVGQGDGTIIKCPGSDGKITILDIGQTSTKNQHGVDEELLFKFLEKIGGPYWQENVDNIFLTHPDEDHYSFFVPVRREILSKPRTQSKVVNVFIGGNGKNKYEFDEDKIRKSIFLKNDNLIEPYGMPVLKDTDPKDETTMKRSNSCGKFKKIKSIGENGEDRFFRCVWINHRNGKTETMENNIEICPSSENYPTAWSLTLMAANFAKDDENTKNNDNANSLVMKLTPSGRSSPSMIFFGDFENKITTQEWKPEDKSRNYNLLIRASTDQYQLGLDKVELKNGLGSDALMLAHHGANTNGNGDDRIFIEIFPPHKQDTNFPSRAFSVISSDIQGSYRHPPCSVIRNILKRYPNGKFDGDDFAVCREADTARYKEIGFRYDTNFLILQTTTVKLDDPTNYFSNFRYERHFIKTTLFYPTLSDDDGEEGFVDMKECNPEIRGDEIEID